jgi:N-acetylneuraminic acid mutarotase
MSRSFQLSMLTSCILFAACNDDQSPLQPSTTEDPSALSPTVAAAATGSWTSKAPLPIGRYFGHAAATVRNSAGQQLVYLFGGLESNCFDEPALCTVRDVDVYNLATNSWTTRRQIIEHVGYQLNGAGVIGSRVYIAGGTFDSGDGEFMTSQLNVYDTRTDTWLQKAQMPSESSQGVSGVIDGKLYVLTGLENGNDECGTFCSDPVITRKFYRYNPATNTWASRPWPKRGHVGGAAGVINGKLYVAGGGDANGEHGVLEIYDPATNRWTMGAPMPSVQSNAAGAVLGARLYVIGGRNADGKVTVYNPNTNSWTSRAPLLTPRSDLAATKVDTHILALGGGSVEGADKNEMFTR